MCVCDCYIYDNLLYFVHLSGFIMDIYFLNTHECVTHMCMCASLLQLSFIFLYSLYTLLCVSCICMCMYHICVCHSTYINPYICCFLYIHIHIRVCMCCLFLSHICACVTYNTYVCVICVYTSYVTDTYPCDTHHMCIIINKGF